MGHWAKVENYVNNVGDVTEILHVTDDADVSGGKLSGSPSDWVQYSYNVFGGVYYVPDSTGETSMKTPADNQATVIAAQDGRQRKNCPGVGYKYDKTRDMFYEAQPYASWTLNNTTGLWSPPITMPTDKDNAYYWDESAYQADNTQGWTETNPDE